MENLKGKHEMGRVINNMNKVRDALDYVGIDFTTFEVAYMTYIKTKNIYVYGSSNEMIGLDVTSVFNSTFNKLMVFIQDKGATSLFDQELNIERNIINYIELINNDLIFNDESVDHIKTPTFIDVDVDSVVIRLYNKK